MVPLINMLLGEVIVGGPRRLRIDKLRLDVVSGGKRVALGPGPPVDGHTPGVDQALRRRPGPHRRMAAEGHVEACPLVFWGRVELDSGAHPGRRARGPSTT